MLATQCKVEVLHEVYSRYVGNEYYDFHMIFFLLSRIFPPSFHDPFEMDHTAALVVGFAQRQMEIESAVFCMHDGVHILPLSANRSVQSDTGPMKWAVQPRAPDPYTSFACRKS